MRAIASVLVVMMTMTSGAGCARRANTITGGGLMIGAGIMVMAASERPPCEDDGDFFDGGQCPIGPSGGTVIGGLVAAIGLAILVAGLASEDEPPPQDPNAPPPPPPLPPVLTPPT